MAKSKIFCKHGHLLSETRAFRKNGDAYCRVCKTEKYQEWRIKNQKRLTDYHRKYQQTDAGFNSKLKYQFGITVEDYNKLNTGICHICNKPEILIDKRYGTNFRLAVDHCHKTGRIRGLLCRRCNVVLGLIKEQTSLLSLMENYITKHEKKNCVGP